MDKGKAVYWILGILGIFLIIGGGLGVYIYGMFFKAAPLATLVIEQGTVQYNSGTSWKDASNGMTLKQDYSVKTLSGSLAKIIFSDSVIRMDENTEIRLEALTPEKVSIMQSIGSTWSRLLKISGISDYEVNTPDAIASVRGTGFSVKYDGKDTDVKVADGNVSVDSYELENGAKKKIASMLVEANKELKVRKDSLDKLEKGDLVEDAWIIKNKNLDEEHKKELKQKIMKKYGTIINFAKNKYGFSDAQMNEIFDDWISGKISVKKKIASGEIPAEAAGLIPAEFKRY